MRQSWQWLLCRIRGEFRFHPELFGLFERTIGTYYWPSLNRCEICYSPPVGLEDLLSCVTCGISVHRQCVGYDTKSRASFQCDVCQFLSQGISIDSVSCRWGSSIFEVLLLHSVGWIFGTHECICPCFRTYFMCTVFSRRRDT